MFPPGVHLMGSSPRSHFQVVPSSKRLFGPLPARPLVRSYPWCAKHSSHPVSSFRGCPPCILEIRSYHLVPFRSPHQRVIYRGCPTFVSIRASITWESIQMVPSRGPLKGFLSMDTLDGEPSKGSLSGSSLLEFPYTGSHQG
jgi:hypothetical protein